MGKLNNENIVALYKLCKGSTVTFSKRLFKRECVMGKVMERLKHKCEALGYPSLVNDDGRWIKKIKLDKAEIDRLRKQYDYSERTIRRMIKEIQVLAEEQWLKDFSDSFQ